ncbi:hypothetical protein RFI36_10735 [Acinetobacter gerneri]|uniref:Lipoprotein n=1 Tax=Acinetobacter gerneri TaxID=202952 RepID=A0AAW8JJ82_9GAMM|nr:hypothetical protein [Acinetobacter gerneri]MDQ9010211.1 hypothetical protein [Acinetobacter gerneri]MDQ9014376.1 hypothetical protein [Acinetobacter gerneri]MDQ9025547.1 hypothetical protein [Acinetobacter gerneri]MDQ9052770.1 hypothetical protein [Acinetobacter gerneri]MDQ9060446.1 hypothetical protein [Acinetobacter gerneri]
MNKYLLSLILCGLSISLTACFLGSFGPLPMDVHNNSKYYEFPGGGLVMDCRGYPLGKDSEVTDYFWDKNNLPRGTLNFVCRDGKAYLPEKAPPKK